MAIKRRGRQDPTAGRILEYTDSFGGDAIEIYNRSQKREAQEWQEKLLAAILSYNDEGLWIHTRFGYSVPRRNGKNEVVSMREMWGLCNGEKILHTAHRTTTSSAAWVRLVTILEEAGFTEGRDADFTTTKQYGLEKITMKPTGGEIHFRTRSSKGGLGEGFDLLVIDEAQEYTTDQETALKYVVTDSKNPQTLFCGTPPTAVSAGTVFMHFRDDVLAGSVQNAGWAEWSVDEMTDQNDREAWYETNPSLGTILTERAIADETGGDELDFNIQRLGLWIRYNLKSAISKTEWEALKVEGSPELTGKMFCGIKYGKDGTNVAVSIAIKTEDKKIFVESVDCRPIRAGTDWIVQFISQAHPAKVVVDGAAGQLLAKAMKDARVKPDPILPTVKEVIVANAMFEQMLESKTLCHSNQPSLAESVTNCEKRPIGSSGGFGYKSIRDTVDIALMDSVIYAAWICAESKEPKKQKISY